MCLTSSALEPSKLQGGHRGDGQAGGDRRVRRQEDRDLPQPAQLLQESSSLV